MEQRYLGEHGLLLSSVALGTRTWGLDTDVHEASEMFSRYVDAGGNTFEVEDDPDYVEPADTLATLIAESQRDRIRLILRSGNRGFVNGSHAGTSRGALLRSLDSTLARLGTDHVDLWLLEGPLRHVRIEELVSAAHLAWSTGRARYVGLGSLNGWQGGSANAQSRSLGFNFSAWSSRVSVLDPLLASAPAADAIQAGMGLIAGAPLAGGLLTGKYQHSTPPDARATSPRFKPEFSRYDNSSTRAVVEALRKAAEGLDRSAAQVALAWARDKAGVTSAVIGPRNSRQLEHLLALGDWSLPGALTDVLTEVALQKAKPAGF